MAASLILITRTDLGFRILLDTLHTNHKAQTELGVHSNSLCSVMLDITFRKLYFKIMIKSFKDKNTETLFSGKFVKEFSGFQRQATRRLQILDSAPSLNDLRALPSNRFEALKGNRKGEYSISINMQWRVCFKWYQDNPQEVGIEDYH